MDKTPTTPPALAIDYENLDVAELKRWLRAAGFPPGPTPYNGRFDEAAEAAVRAFQEAQGLDPDGMVGPLTRAALAETLGIVGPEVCR